MYPRVSPDSLLIRQSANIEPGWQIPIAPATQRQHAASGCPTEAPRTRGKNRR